MKPLFGSVLEWRRKNLTMLKVVDGLITITPLITSTPPAMLVFAKSQEQLRYTVVQAALTALAIELLGWFAMVLRQRIQKHNLTYTAKKAQIPAWPTWVIYSVYLALVLGITVTLELGVPDVWINALVALLSLPGTWLAGLYYRMEEIQAEYRSHKAESRSESGDTVKKPKVKKANPDELSGTLRKVYDAFTDTPHETNTAVAESVGITRQLVGRYRTRLTEGGYLRNGSGQV